MIPLNQDEQVWLAKHPDHPKAKAIAEAIIANKQKPSDLQAAAQLQYALNGFRKAIRNGEIVLGS